MQEVYLRTTKLCASTKLNKKMEKHFSVLFYQTYYVVVCTGIAPKFIDKSHKRSVVNWRDELFHLR